MQFGGVSVTPEAGAAMALLTLLADPSEAKRRVEEYNTAKTAHDAAFAALTKANAEFLLLHENITQEHAKREAEIDASEARLERDLRDFEAAKAKYDKFVDERLAIITQREADLQEAGLKNARWSSGLTQQQANAETAMKKVEDSLAELEAKEADAARHLAEALKLKAEYENKLEQLRKVMIS